MTFIIGAFVNTMPSIIEKLTGQYLDGTPFHGVESHHIEFLRKSVCDNLYRLLNTKKGMHFLHESLGISDTIVPIGNIQKFKDLLRQEILENISLFEPRLNHARCMPMDVSTPTANLAFRISGSLQGFRCHFQVEFVSTGQCLVSAV